MQKQHIETSASVSTLQAVVAAENNQPVLIPERRRFVTINECAIIRPFSGQALRDMKFKAFDRKSSRGEVIPGNGTGVAGVWVQIGAKVLVDLDALDRWIESRRITRVDD